jgi:hypothetical protein
MLQKYQTKSFEGACLILYNFESQNNKTFLEMFLLKSESNGGIFRGFCTPMIYIASHYHYFFGVKCFLTTLGK